MEFKIENLGFAAAGAFMIYAATIEDRMTLNLAAMEPLYSRERIKRIAEMTAEILEQNV